MTKPKLIAVEIMKRRTVGLLFKKYKLCGEIIVDGIGLGDFIEFELPKTVYLQLAIGDRLHVLSYHNGDLDLPNCRNMPKK